MVMRKEDYHVSEFNFFGTGTPDEHSAEHIYISGTITVDSKTNPAKIYLDTDKIGDKNQLAELEEYLFQLQEAGCAGVVIEIISGAKRELVVDGEATPVYLEEFGSFNDLVILKK